MINQVINSVSSLGLLVNHLYSGVLDLENKKYVITLKEWKPKRSDSQNRLMWMWNSEFAKWMFEHKGETVSAEDVHEYLVIKFWPMEYNPLTKKERRAETSKFGVDKMAEHLERMQHRAAEAGIELTQPYDYNYAMTGKE